MSSLFKLKARHHYKNQFGQTLSSPERPRYMRRQVDAIPAGITPGGLIELLEDVIPKIVLFEEGLSFLLSADAADEITDLLASIENETGSQSLAWAFFMNWIAQSLAGEIILSRHAARTLQQTLLRLEKEAGENLAAWLKDKLPDLKKDSWGRMIPT